MNLKNDSQLINLKKKENCFIVLGHEINQKTFFLSKSSQARCSKLAELIIKNTSFNKSSFTIFMGLGRKQGKCKFSISECMHKYFEENFFKIKDYFLDKKSLDSVGDAIFSFKYIEEINFNNNIIIITSDWHLERAKKIFKKIYGIKYNLTFSKTNEFEEMSSQEKKVIKLNELRSLELFNNNFKNYNQLKYDPINFLINNHNLY